VTIRGPPKESRPDRFCRLCGACMNPYFETLSVIFVAFAGICLGRRISRLPNPWWAYALVVPVLMLALLIISTCTNLLGGLPPVLFITAGRARYVILSLAITLGLTTPLSRLPYRLERTAVALAMVVFVALFSVLPFLVPALIQDDLSRITTRIDGNGVCFQSKSYTCGPAAAVTALARCGFTAHEGELAVLARTNPVSGTLLWTLYSAIKERYAPLGLDCRFRQFDSVAQLRNAGVALVSIRQATLLDHCVAVLDVSDTGVTIADPVTGLTVLPVEQFDQIWRRCGIVMNRQPQLSKL
jgi:predicted double-glycine peptidase